jgi:predicted PurR-regulated permease PerM
MGAIQGTLGGLMFWWLGLPAPVLWGVVMAVLATVPNLGAFVVWAPAAVGLAFQEEWAKAGILTAWGLIAIGLIDNMLYPFMVGQRIHMHSLPVFFSILGGLYLFGAAGLILGPVVFALTHALLEIWRRRTAAGRAAENGTPPSPRALLEEEGMS